MNHLLLLLSLLLVYSSNPIVSLSPTRRLLILQPTPPFLDQQSLLVLRPPIEIEPVDF